MSLLKWMGAVAAAVVVAATPAVASAQLAVYGTVTGERISSIQCGDPENRCAASGGVAKPYGSNFGVQYDFRHYGPLTVGFDARGGVTNSNKSAAYYLGGEDTVRHYEVLGGVRAVVHTPFNVLRPYVEGAAGLARTNAIYTAPVAGTPAVVQYSNYTQVEGLAGLDLALFPLVDIRVVELGAGAIFGGNGGSHPIEQVGIGVVFHLPR